MQNVKELKVEDMGKILGGRNSWQTNVSGAVGSAIAGAGLGGAICGPACAYVGAHYGPIIWGGVTGATGGFGKIK